MNKYPVLVCKNCMQMWNYRQDYCPYCYATKEMIVDITDKETIDSDVKDKESLEIDSLKETISVSKRGDKK